MIDASLKQTFVLVRCYSYVATDCTSFYYYCPKCTFKLKTCNLLIILIILLINRSFGFLDSNLDNTSTIPIQKWSTPLKNPLLLCRLPRLPSQVSGKSFNRVAVEWVDLEFQILILVFLSIDEAPLEEKVRALIVVLETLDRSYFGKDRVKKIRETLDAAVAQLDTKPIDNL